MNWEEIIMNALWGLVGSIIGVVGTLGYGVWSDKKGYNNIDRKIGILNNTTLSGQHSEISNLVKTINESVTNTITERSRFSDEYSMKINSKIDQIAKTVDRNESRYENLNLDQREVRNNVNKLVNSWESLVNENKALKELIIKIEKENEILKYRIKEHNRKSEKNREHNEYDYEDDWENEV